MAPLGIWVYLVLILAEHLRTNLSSLGMIVDAI